MPKDKNSGKKLADMMYGNPERAAFGITPMIGKRREDRQDREAAKSFPVDLARGVTAGFLGMPADILNIPGAVYSAVTDKDLYNIPYGSEDILKRLPFGTDTPAGQFASGLGSIAGGSANIGPMIRGAKALPGALKTAARNLSTPRTMSPEAGAVRIKASSAPQEKAMRLAQQRAALPVEQGGLGLPANNTPEMRAEAMGYIDYLHGTQRMDRLLEGKTLNPRRATSGPMPYGTTTPELASSYAMSKADTSRRAMDEGDARRYFEVAPKDIGVKGIRTPIPVEQAWNFMSPEQKTRIQNLAPRVGYEDLDQYTGEFIVHPEGVNATLSPSQWDWFMKNEAKGNPLTALRNMWYESGQLVDEPERLAEIFKLAGVEAPISQTNAPWTEAQGVLLGKARLTNPIDTSNTEQIRSLIEPLKQAFAKDRSRVKTGGPDQWAKDSRYTPKSWVSELEKDLAENKESYVWTSIPDKVTDELTKLGFNGIIDRSGKGGGAKEPVVIPFNPDQIRSRFAAFDPLRKTAATAAAAGLAAPDLLAEEAPKSEVHFSDNPDVMQLELAGGGAIRMQAGGLAKAAKAAAKAIKPAEAPMKASEALGRIEGRPLVITQADRTKVGGGYLGGPGFSGLQLEDPAYRAAEAAWGVKTPGVAKMILGGGKTAGKDPVYAAMLGTPTQHQSNQMVFDKLYGDFKKSAKKGNLDSDLRDRINMRLANTVDKEGNLIFPPDVDILGKNFKDLANTFDRRAVTANLIGGMGVGGKKGQIIDYDKIIRETTDPLLIDSPTGALGNRLFTLSGGIIERPDLHPAFPTILQGEDLGVSFSPVARDLIMKDFTEKTMREKGRAPGYMDYTRGYPPSQLITEDILTEMQKLGLKKGGAVRMAGGGEVHGLSTADLLFLQSQEDLGKLPAHAQREAITNMGGQEVRQRMAGKMAAGGEITADDLILEERKL